MCNDEKIVDPFRASASTGTRLVIGIDASTPDGLSQALAIGAGECLMGAKTLDKAFSDLTGEYILTFHAIELGLKAFLIKCWLSEEELRKKKFGHDLDRLYDEAVKRGLSLNVENAEKLLVWVNEWHNEGVKIRYQFIGERTLPICATLFPLVEAIISASK